MGCERCFDEGVGDEKVRKNIGWESKCVRREGVFGANEVETSVRGDGIAGREVRIGKGGKCV